METARPRPEFRMRLESRLLFAAALAAILIALLAGHNRAIAQERDGVEATTLTLHPSLSNAARTLTSCRP
jgi:hypothetical protein